MACLAIFFSLGNIIILDFYQIIGCRVLGSACIPHIQPLFQACLALVLLVPLYGFALRVFAVYDMTDPRRATDDPEFDVVFALGLPRRKVMELMGLIVVMLACGVTVILLLTAFSACALLVRFYARIMGMCSSLLTLFQWVPQITLTLTIQERGTLSLSMLSAYFLLDVFSIFYLNRVHEDWSIWLNNLADMIMVCSLMSLVLYFENRQQRVAGKKRISAGEEASLIDDKRGDRVEVHVSHA